ncbi:30S ribosomal protein S6 [Nesterenkonia halophila]|uniref:30S ribosomal protein S6 n=1 Tax=Nesterenkonia halophila TaxID=302044 RepID=UPI0012928DA6|nr:30S ribosomal protein S6 [Nesterenkonia halophila]
MRHYELMVLVDPEVDERTVEPTLAKYMEIVKRDGGSVEGIDVWGRRRLAYEIKKNNEAVYAVVDFHATPDSAAELDRLLRLNETIMRTKIIRPEDQRVA